MLKVKLVLLLGVALTLAACADRNNRDDTAAIPADEVAQDAAPMYLAYVQKMIAATSDDGEPWDIDTVRVEQSDTAEVVDVM